MTDQRQPKKPTATSVIAMPEVRRRPSRNSRHNSTAGDHPVPGAARTLFRQHRKAHRDVERERKAEDGGNDVIPGHVAAAARAPSSSSRALLPPRRHRQINQRQRERHHRRDVLLGVDQKTELAHQIAGPGQHAEVRATARALIRIFMYAADGACLCRDDESLVGDCAVDGHRRRDAMPAPPVCIKRRQEPPSAATCPFPCRT